MDKVKELEAKVADTSAILQKQVDEFNEVVKNLRMLRTQKKQLMRNINVLDGAVQGYKDALQLVKGPIAEVIPAQEA